MQISDRMTAGALFVFAACLPAGIWVIYLFVGNSDSLTWLGALEFAFSAENANRSFFVALAASLVFSVVAAALLLATHLSQAALKVLLVGGVVQCLVYVFASTWVLAVIAATPLFWLGRLYKEGLTVNSKGTR